MAALKQIYILPIFIGGQQYAPQVRVPNPTQKYIRAHLDWN